MPQRLSRSDQVSATTAASCPLSGSLTPTSTLLPSPALPSRSPTSFHHVFPPFFICSCRINLYFYCFSPFRLFLCHAGSSLYACTTTITSKLVLAPLETRCECTAIQDSRLVSAAHRPLLPLRLPSVIGPGSLANVRRVLVALLPDPRPAIIILSTRLSRGSP
jgi:hypothetical protein